MLQLFFFVARVSGGTPLAGPVAKKKAVTTRQRTGIIQSKSCVIHGFTVMSFKKFLKNGHVRCRPHPPVLVSLTSRRHHTYRMETKKGDALGRTIPTTVAIRHAT